ncbi:MAG: hypothetical protein ACRDN0_40955 [Trebonia sp.]
MAEPRSAAFRRGWILMAVAAAPASAVGLVVRPDPARTVIPFLNDSGDCPRPAVDGVPGHEAADAGGH